MAIRYGYVIVTAETTARQHPHSFSEVNGDYSPTNCRFVSMVEQNNNRRNNRLVTMDGKTQSVTQWCRELGLNSRTVNSRIHRGWNPVDALTNPIHHEFASKGKVTA